MWLLGVVAWRYIDSHNITYPYSTCINFFAAASLLLCSVFKCFLFLFMLFLCNIANIAQRTFEIVQKSRSHEHSDIIISTRTYMDCARKSPETHTCDVPCDVSRKLQLTLCAIMAS